MENRCFVNIWWRKKNWKIFIVLVNGRKRLTGLFLFLGLLCLFFFMGLFDSEAVRRFILQFWKLWATILFGSVFIIQNQGMLPVSSYSRQEQHNFFLISTFLKENLKYIIYENRNKKIEFYFRTEHSRYPVSFILWRYNLSFFFRSEVSCIVQTIFDIVKLFKKK